MERKDAMIAVIRFLNQVGLVTVEETGAHGFIPGVDIRDGTLVYDPATATASNLLHEAGHLATVPGRLRKLFNGNVSKGQRLALQAMDDEEVEPDSPLFVAIMQCSDTEATAWAWAAGRHLGIPDEQIIQDDEYGDDGASIRLMLSMKSYVGINGLSRAGFCSIREASARVSGKPAYPEMKMWIQPDDLPAH